MFEMNPIFRKIITDFQNKSDEANTLLKASLGVSNPEDWHGAVPQQGPLGEKQRYFFHGTGCVVHLSDSEIVNFEYCEGGRVDCFNEWIICEFFSNRCSAYPSTQEHDIKSWFRESVETGELLGVNSGEFSNLYFLPSNT